MIQQKSKPDQPAQVHGAVEYGRAAVSGHVAMVADIGTRMKRSDYGPRIHKYELVVVSHLAVR